MNKKGLITLLQFIGIGAGLPIFIWLRFPYIFEHGILDVMLIIIIPVLSGVTWMFLEEIKETL